MDIENRLHWIELNPELQLQPNPWKKDWVPD